MVVLRIFEGLGFRGVFFRVFEGFRQYFSEFAFGAIRLYV